MPFNIGNFSGSRNQEFVISRGQGYLELLRPDETGKLISVSSTQVFSIIRSLIPFRLAGELY